ncbi:MAG: class I SAM-dependent methyltransferase [Gemmatimonadales bacterium]|nr:class I SAM-dependent methyltransferase [Gemmatimonadales bacterium]
MSGGTDPFGPAYYAAHAADLGWGPDSRPDPAKLAFLEAEVRGARLLDVGCGPGVYAAALARAGRSVVGVDYSAGLLAAGRARNRAFTAACAPAEALPFRDRSFDTTLLLSILEHGDDLELLREAARVTRERVILQVPLAEPEFLARAGLLFSHWSDRSHLRTYTERSLADLVAQAQCRLVAISPAFPRDITDLYVSALRVPGPVRTLVRAALKPLKRFVSPAPAEGFVVAEPR